MQGGRQQRASRYTREPDRTTAPDGIRAAENGVSARTPGQARTGGPRTRAALRGGSPRRPRPRRSTRRPGSRGRDRPHTVRPTEPWIRLVVSPRSQRRGSLPQRNRKYLQKGMFRHPGTPSRAVVLRLSSSPRPHLGRRHADSALQSRISPNPAHALRQTTGPLRQGSGSRWLREPSHDRLDVLKARDQ
jgi:hypothetical protein